MHSFLHTISGWPVKLALKMNVELAQGSIWHSESECPKCPLPTPCSQNVHWFVNVGHHLVFHASVNGSSSNKYRPRAPVTQINRYPIDKVISRLQGCKSMIDWSRCWWMKNWNFYFISVNGHFGTMASSHSDGHFVQIEPWIGVGSLVIEQQLIDMDSWWSLRWIGTAFRSFEGQEDDGIERCYSRCSHLFSEFTVELWH